MGSPLQNLDNSFSCIVRVYGGRLKAMTAPQTPTTADELRGAGLRVTAARVALLETVREGDHLGVEAIASGVRDRVGHISLQAVYEALHALTTAGLVRRIEPPGSPARFEGRVGDNHHHLVCRSCGAVEDFDLAGLNTKLARIATARGYAALGHTLEVAGICSACRGRHA